MKIDIKSLKFFCLIVLFLLNTLLILSPITDAYRENYENTDIVISTENSSLKPADIAGSDLYAEKISAYVAGSKSIIKQSLFTNDTNIIDEFDLNDPAFEKCSMYLSVSNAINPEIFPRVLVNEKYPNEFCYSFQSFTGLLYYDDELTQDQIDSKLDRALDIIRSKFKVDLIMINISNPNYYGFVGYLQDWEFYLDQMTSNFPKDGYWKALDLERLRSKNYSSNHHLSSTYILINSVEFIEEEINISTDQLYYNFDVFDLSLNNSIISEFSQILGIGGENASSSDGDQFSEEIGGTTLLNNSHYSYFSLQYEGRLEGIRAIGDSQYEFDLWSSMGYSGEPLDPSEKVYIALVGAFISEIEIQVLDSSIISSVPKNFEFSDYLIEQIGLLSSFAGGDFDVESLTNYTFSPLWFSKEGIKTNGVKISNKEDPNDIVNALQLTGFQGLEMLPTGLLNPIEKYVIRYNITQSEENLKITQKVVGDNASYGVRRDFTLNITVENVGNKTAWGIETPYLLELIDIEQLFGEATYEDLWGFVQIYYPEYNSLEEFLNLDKPPRLFYFDSTGDGVADQYFPSLSLSNLFPYSEEMPQLIDYMYYDNQFLYTILNPFSDNFTNPDSIWNDDNWKIEPRDSISYEIQNLDISDLDSYHEFCTCDFVVDPLINLPELIEGKTYEGTTPEMAQANDEDSWIIISNPQYEGEEIELNLVFQNSSIIDFKNYELDNVSILLDVSIDENISDISFQVFNFTKEEFVNIDNYLSFIENDTRIFSFLKLNYSIDWLYESTNNYTIILKIQAFNQSRFNITLNEVNVRFSQREINFEERVPIVLSFSNEIGSAFYEIQSNSILLSTHNMASIIAYSSLKEYNSTIGVVNEYSITIKNIGSTYAKDVNISVIIPGIIENDKDFHVYRNNLSIVIPYLNPLQETTASFTYYNPNSASITGARVEYHNPKALKNGISTRLVSYSNDIKFSAPVDYVERVPYLRILGISLNSTNSAPKINSTLTLNISFTNLSPNRLDIEEVTLNLNDQFGSLHVISSSQLTSNSIKYKEVDSKELQLVKKDWDGYFYPAVMYISGKESRTIRISSSNSIIMGNISFNMEKFVDKKSVRIGESIEVSIRVTNTGTITMKNIEVNDADSFASHSFSLLYGKLVNSIDVLEPGQSKVVSYTIQAKIQTKTTFESASIEYYYIHQTEQKSNPLSIMVIAPPLLQYFFVLIPAILSTIFLLLYYRKQLGYQRVKLEMERYESSLLKLSSRDSIFKIEHTLRKRLEIFRDGMQKSNDIEGRFNLNEPGGEN